MRKVLRRVGLRNFKAAREADVELSLLTLLVGPNSAGKSTLLQAILLQAQAAASEVRGEFFPLNGPRARLGSFDEARWTGAASSSERIGISGSITFVDDDSVEDPRAYLLETMENVEWELAFSQPDARAPSSMRVTESVLSVRQNPERRLIDDSEQVVEKEPSFVLWSGYREGDEPRLEALRRGVWGDDHTALWIVEVEGSLESGQGAPEELVAVDYAAGLPRRVLVETPLGLLLADQWSEALYDIVQRMRRTSGRRTVPYSSLRAELDSLQRRIEGARRDGDSALIRRLEERRGQLERQFVELGADARVTKDSEISEELALQVAAWAQEDYERLSRDEVPLTEARAAFRRFLEQRITVDAALELAGLRRREIGRAARTAAIHPTSPVASVPAFTEPAAADYLADHCDIVLDFLRKSVRYLGPLRAAPKPVHAQVPNPQSGDIGDLGENTAAVVHACGGRRVQNPTLDAAIETVPLTMALNYWLEHLKLGGSIETEDLGRLGISLTIEQPSSLRPVDLTAVGVGVSQVLPVLTLCLLSDPGSLIILEQPELHLHPATQQLLADFFLACARSGRQLLVETHSDHLVSRIRRRIAEDRSGVVKELATIVFAEQHPAEGTSYRPIEVSDYGSVEDWPEGFFDQAATEAQAILKEAVARRKEARAAGEGVE